MTTTALLKTIPVARPSIGPAEEAAIVEALRSGWISQGPRVNEFERQFAEYTGAAHAVAVSSCTTALHLALVAAGIKPGDEVLCPSLSFIASANAIVHAGAMPVFVDIDESTYNLDPEGIEAAVTPRTKAILVVHQVGLPAAMDAIRGIAERHKLVIIEDAACAIGSSYKGHRIGSSSTAMACFSFHPRKVLTTGEGGMITTADEKLSEQLRRLRQHGMTVSDLARHSSSKVLTECYVDIGYNYRMTDMQAAIGIVQLNRLDKMLERRRALAANYAAGLASLRWLSLPDDTAQCRHNFQSYMVRLRSDAPVTRDIFMQRLLDSGISTRRGVMAIHREPPYYKPEWDARLPKTNAITDSTVILPLYQDMTASDQEYVIGNIQDIGMRS